MSFCQDKGALVTAQARLYDAIDKIGDRVLYFATDSVIFVSRPGEYETPTGNFLGDFKDDIGGGNYIEEFVSAGPKNYAYKLNTGKTKCAIKGFTQLSIASLKLNF